MVFGTVWYGTHYYMEIQFFDKLRDVSPEKDILNYPTCFCYNTRSSSIFSKISRTTRFRQQEICTSGNIK